MAVPMDEFPLGAMEIRAVLKPGYEQILTPPALAFLAALHRRFDARRRALLEARVARQARFDAGELPDFLAHTRAIRESDWTVAPIPAALQDRRIEITGPVDRKMIINALNSGARVFMADFEDSSAPTWENLIDGQVNLRDAVAGTIEYRAADGREYRLKPECAVLVVRPRGWHLPEKHARVGGEEMAGALFDFGLFAYHNARALQERDRGPYFYLPKLESHREAELWDEVMAFAESELGLPAGCMKATVLIETLPAVFEMDEILHALRTRIVGLNCGRWDYIFSYLKTFRAHRTHILPERGQVGMTVPFLKAYSELLIKTCHRRGAFAMGGMAAQIPISGDPQANEKALARVRADKQREARAGHDGTWVAHPGLIPVALAEFDAAMPTPNQLHQRRDDVHVTRDDLITAPAGTITRAGFENNIDVCVRYLAAWLDGLGCVPIHHLMEDAATAEISRAQLWQWLHHEGLTLEDGTPLDFTLFDHAIQTIGERLPKSGLPGQERIPQAAWMLAELTHAKTLADFLTLPAYALLP
ncbi:malate synthase A [Tahibacter amnicola]|uniref:malate synthase n=1 Tax=Tahibacter amnicola TaxID=2976241 RepID=A0ABY6BGS5_9GAMM|nr:malate synthase A [Tahibacter amnicola]UXI68518.1 malate synthase A [Tahibacter amnicola]